MDEFRGATKSSCSNDVNDSAKKHDVQRSAGGWYDCLGPNVQHARAIDGAKLSLYAYPPGFDVEGKVGIYLCMGL